MRLGEGNVSPGVVMFPCVTGPSIVWGRVLAVAVKLPDKEERVPWRTWSLEPGSHVAPGPQGEPRWRGSLAQVYQHLSAVPWQDEAQVDISLVSLEAKGPQRGEEKAK